MTTDLRGIAFVLLFTRNFNVSYLQCSAQMPVRHSTNNRVLNNNARASDVAKQAVDLLVPVQNRRYLEAFKVQGLKAVLYAPLRSGVPCSCKNRSKAAASFLAENGKASQGLINQLLTGENFSVLPYGVQPAKPAVDESGVEALSSVYERMNGNGSAMTEVGDGYATNPADPRGRTLLPTVRTGQEDANTGYLADEFDNLIEFEDPSAETWGLEGEQARTITPDAGLSAAGFYDVSCPICFGTGFVGGYSIHNGFRFVISLTVNAPSWNLSINAGAVAQFNETTPVVSDCLSFSFDLPLPRHVVGIDALRVFNGTKSLGATIRVDSTTLTSEHQLVNFCDGRTHTITVTFPSPTSVSHVEVQLNQSNEWTLFEFPRLSRSGDPLTLDDTDPFSINVSPSIPNLVPWSVLAESTYGKVLLVKTVQSWNTRNRQVLGWDCEVRVVQGSELYNLLPRRKIVKSQNRPAMVRDNRHGQRRT